MKLLYVLACVVTLAGIGMVADGTFPHLGYILLIEGGVLLTLIQENRRKPVR
jgi:hypothetical protein